MPQPPFLRLYRGDTLGFRLAQPVVRCPGPWRPRPPHLPQEI